MAKWDMLEQMRVLICTLWAVAFLAGCVGQDVNLDEVIWLLGSNQAGGSSEVSGINAEQGAESGSPIPDRGGALSLEIINKSGIDARVIVRFLLADVEVHKTQLLVPAHSRANVVGPDVATRVEVNGTFVGGQATPSVVMIFSGMRPEDLSSGYITFEPGDIKEYIILDPYQSPDSSSEIPDSSGTIPPESSQGQPESPGGDEGFQPEDACPDDPDKTEPGVCGCGVPDVDGDGDGTLDCNDLCPGDPDKSEPGICGCGVSDIDSDEDGTADCNDFCPSDPAKTEPGVCGCGEKDTDGDGDGSADCIDGCPVDPEKTEPGLCGCGVPDTDSDGDGTPDCKEKEEPPPGGGGPKPEPECKPTADGRSCESVACPESEHQCMSKKIRVDYGKGSPSYSVLECECISYEDCHVEIYPPDQVYCSGSCPSGEECELIEVYNGNDSYDYECVCKPVSLQGCCLPDGVCIDLTLEDCITQEGTPLEASCTGTMEACCLDGGTTCMNMDPLCCEQQDGVPLGPGTQCTQEQACCLGDGCVDMDPLCCENLDGIPQGSGNKCADETEACCLDGGGCVDVDPLCCDELGGISQGTGTICLGDQDNDGTDDACEQGSDLEACCWPDGTCTDEYPDDCVNCEGRPQGPETDCDSVSCDR